MTDYKEIFAKHGYALHEPESLEIAIVEAVKENKIRYLYGVPILIERSEVDFEFLIKLAKKEKVLGEMKELLYICSKVVRDKRLVSKLKKISKGQKKRSLSIDGFKEAYENFKLSKQYKGFSSDIGYHLSFIFAKKQIAILYKIKAGKKLTKTEKEYFSRTIKKKLVAIREVFPLAKEILVKG